MKNKLQFAFACIAVFAGQAFAEQCYVGASVVSSIKPKVTIVLDVVQVTSQSPIEGSGKLHLSEGEENDLRARALNYAKRNLKQAEGDVDAGANFVAADLSYGSDCFKEASSAENFRAIKIKFDGHVLHGNWSAGSRPVAAKPEEIARSRKNSVDAAILTRSPDSSKPTPEMLAAQAKRDAVRKKSEEAAAAAAKSKAATDANAAKLAEDSRRQICLKPEHKGDCGCARFYPPDPKQTVCSK